MKTKLIKMALTAAICIVWLAGCGEESNSESPQTDIPPELSGPGSDEDITAPTPVSSTAPVLGGDQTHVGATTPPAGSVPTGPTPPATTPCVKTDPLQYLICRFQQSKISTEAAGPTVNKQLVSCSKADQKDKHILLKTFTYSSAKPANALWCYVLVNGEAKGFAHNTRDFCKNNNTKKHDSLTELQTYYTNNGYTCAVQDPNVCSPECASYFQQ